MTIIQPTFKMAADLIVWYAVFQCMIIPVTAIFSGNVWGPGAFIGGAVFVAAILFGEFYFRDETDV